MVRPHLTYKFPGWVTFMESTILWNKLFEISVDMILLCFLPSRVDQQMDAVVQDICFLAGLIHFASVLDVPLKLLNNTVKLLVYII